MFALVEALLETLRKEPLYAKASGCVMMYIDGRSVEGHRIGISDGHDDAYFRNSHWEALD